MVDYTIETSFFFFFFLNSLVGAVDLIDELMSTDGKSLKIWLN